MLDKIAVLFADSDALRRDGMAAVVEGVGSFHVVASCSDGVAALEGIRSSRPDIAVIDLNLPKVHGIEVVRQARSESLGTKIIVVSGTDDDDIIREVVRAGGDGYLLKNGPARHLLDAIQYVRDGGQYFSPHLRRDGLDRRLLEERPYPSAGPASGHASSLRQPMQRDRKEDVPERDYEILSTMAEGIRPILDRLQDIEGKVNGMEAGREPVPNNPGEWLSRQFADTLRVPGGRGTELAHVGVSVREIEARLPQLIEEAVTHRFHSMASKLQHDLEETHVKTLETFVKNIQVKLVSRVSALEKDVVAQAESMNRLRESSQRTEDNLSRLIEGVDKIAQNLPQKLSAEAPAPEAAAPERATEPEERKTSLPASRHNASAKRSSARSRQRAGILGAVAFLVVFGCVWGAAKLAARPAGSGEVHGEAPIASAATAGKPEPLPAGSSAKAKLDMAEQYAQKKEYTLAENLYREVVNDEPRNVEALKGLASVLYRQDKIDESAAILDKIPAH